MKRELDCSAAIRDFHDEKVALTKAQQDKLRGARKANQDRLTENVKKTILRFQKQGSYAMKTMVQEPDNAYDIDDGVVFEAKELVGPQGGELSALDARTMICEALKDKKFTRQPKVEPNCVRVYYNEGYHVDIPVYRDTKSKSEIASSEWKESDPDGVNKWFQTFVDKYHHTDETDGESQFRRTVRFLKYYSKSRTSWNMPSGFIISVLATECFSKYQEREDLALYDIMKAICARANRDKTVNHPVVLGELLAESDDSSMSELGDRLEWAIEQLDNAKDEESMLKAWNDVFNTDFFASKKASRDSGPVVKNGGGKYA